MTTLPYPMIIIPARSGSKRLPGKNLMVLGGKTLLRRCIDTAREVLVRCGGGKIIVVLDRGYDNAQVQSIIEGLSNCVHFQTRPKKLAEDDATTEDLVRYLVAECALVTDPIVLMQCTSPFTTAEHVIECIKAHRLGARQTTFSVVQLDAHLVPSGQVYVFNRGIVDRDTEFFTMTPAATKIITNQALAIDVDTKEDFDRAVALLAEQKKPTAVIAKGKGALQVVSLHCYSTDRADRGHLYPLYEAADKDKRFKAVFTETDHEEWPIHKQDVVFLQGDRTELLEVAAQAIRVGCIIAHAAGGERTKGSTDDCTRDAITKLAHLHYPVHTYAGNRIFSALSEELWRICVAGEIGVDDIKNKPLMGYHDLQEKWPDIFTMPPGHDCTIFAAHPVTNNPVETSMILNRRYLDSFERVYLSQPNKDPGSETIERMFKQWNFDQPTKYILLPNLGAHAFRSLMKLCGTIIGNSSALITEAPHLGCLPILVGTRQEGRFPSESDGNACGRILDHLYAAVTQRGDAIRTKA